MAVLFTRMADALIDVTMLAKRYGGRSVVRDVTVRLEPGQIIGLVGANGGGKTTTLRMLAGLLLPDTGSGRVLGESITARTRHRRGDIGYMPQRLSLYPELSVAENLRFRLRAHGFDGTKARLAEAVERWGLESVLRTRFDRLSGGWGRRAQFAAAMLSSPRLLLLDEPTAGLDVVTRHEIWRWLEILAAQGCGIVISTHDFTEAERCPLILHFAGGAAERPVAPAALIADSGTDTLEAAVAALMR